MRLEQLMRMTVTRGKRYSIGLITMGKRNVWTLSGGTVQGAGIRRTVAPIGGEVELTDSDGVFHIDVRPVIVTDDDANIFVQYFGISHASAEVMERYRRGKTLDFGDTYFVTQPRFETSSLKYAWVNHVLAITEGRGTSSGVDYLMNYCIPDGAVRLAGGDSLFAFRREQEEEKA